MVITRPAVTVLVVCLGLGGGLFAKTTAPKAKQAAAKARTATRKTSSHTKAVAYRKPVPRRATAPTVPASDRIRSVQQALIERGYLQGDANGQWSASSVEALKHFEADQHVKVDGKIDSKMLIALGLGPKYDRNLALPVPDSSTGLVVAADQGSSNEQQRD